MAHKATLTTKLGTRPFHIECSCNGTGGDFFDKESALQFMRLHAQRVKQSSGQDVEIVDKTSVAPKAPVIASGQGGVKISLQPQNQSVQLGQKAQFTVTALGDAPLGYQWQKNGQAIAGATNQSLVIESVAAQDSGQKFNVVVKDSKSSVVSNEAVLTVIGVTPPPVPKVPAPAPKLVAEKK